MAEWFTLWPCLSLGSCTSRCHLWHQMGFSSTLAVTLGVSFSLLSPSFWPLPTHPLMPTPASKKRNRRRLRNHSCRQLRGTIFQENGKHPACSCPTLWRRNLGFLAWNGRQRQRRLTPHRPLLLPNHVLRQENMSPSPCPQARADPSRIGKQIWRCSDSGDQSLRSR